MVHPSKPYNYRPNTSTRLLLAAVAAMMNTCLTLPLDVLSARTQSADLNQDDPDNLSNSNQPSKNKQNWKHVWRGL